MDTKLSFFVVFRCIFEELGTVVRTALQSVLVVRLHNFGQVGKGDAEMFRVGCRTILQHHTAQCTFQCNSLFRPFATCNRPSASSGLPNLPFSLGPPILSLFFFFSNFSYFHPFPSSLPFSDFPGSIFWSSPTCLSVTSLCQLLPREVKQANAHVVKVHFC